MPFDMAAPKGEAGALSGETTNLWTGEQLLELATSLPAQGSAVKQAAMRFAPPPASLLKRKARGSYSRVSLDQAAGVMRTQGVRREDRLFFVTGLAFGLRPHQTARLCHHCSAWLSPEET